MWPFDKEEGEVRYVKNITRFVTIMVDLLVLIISLTILWNGYIMVVNYFNYIPFEVLDRHQMDLELTPEEQHKVTTLSAILLIGLFLQGILIYAYTTWIWYKFATTPGKFLFGVRILDARTLKKMTFKQASIRFFGAILSFIPFGLGIIWSTFDKKSRAWHDKMANTVVIVKKIEF